MKCSPGILAFTHIVLRLNEASAKHLQDMPVKVADRDDTGCADANLTGSLLIFVQLYNYFDLKVKLYFYKYVQEKYYSLKFSF